MSGDRGDRVVQFLGRVWGVTVAGLVDKGTTGGGVM